MALFNYKVPIIMKKKFKFCPGKSRENYQIFFTTFQDLSTKIKDFQGLSRTAKKIQDFSRMWQPCIVFLSLQKFTRFNLFEHLFASIPIVYSKLRSVVGQF